ncbi:hypothetical protein A2774_00235 [Candidatus Roizmanbacteria bacterium RIFCSPHIGHO2_01_FULL_39_12c]|uniref:DUF2061 domain-containing protein n=1 Tax=Candidatus Roizmanbacteria bacterium RIFCSPHIGHO2_01_FULL_39_12c TaxID=1802031 RepID=A0A1F7GDM5_9BACT|nr:MAG: hypothetical protein A2774_00235 [Candidatus Roizmanbacteria bacterium RIFCSPHIGHO2_01_FULL_39_12c]
MKFYEHHQRSLFKALSFRFIIVVIDFFVIILFSKRYDLALGLVAFSSFTHTLIYFLHERIWNKVHWGKKK